VSSRAQRGIIIVPTVRPVRRDNEDPSPDGSGWQQDAQDDGEQRTGHPAACGPAPPAFASSHWYAPGAPIAVSCRIEL